MGCAFLYVKEWEGKKRVSLPQSAMLTAPSSEGADVGGDRTIQVLWYLAIRFPLNYAETFNGATIAFEKGIE